MKTYESPVMIDPVGGDTSALDGFGFKRLHASDLSEVDEGKSYDPVADRGRPGTRPHLPPSRL